jgi:ABC-type phosphate transport system substrate-binding protein
MSIVVRFLRPALIVGLFLVSLFTLSGWVVFERARVSAQSDEGLVVIINGRNPTNSLALSEAKKLFTGQTSFWHGVVPVKLLTRPDSSPAAKAFFQALGVTAQSYHKQWDELQLAGRGVAPKSVASIQDVATAVSQTPGGLSFALASEAWNVQLKGVKIIPIR